MWDSADLVIVILTFVLAGVIKGVVGLGLPTVALALLTATLGLKSALALLIFPSLATNVWQALAGPSLTAIVRRLWSFFAAIFVGAWVGAIVLANWDADLLAALLGGVLMVYAGLSLLHVRLPHPGRSETWLSPVLGLANGVLTGMTGTFVVPGLMYIQALGLKRDDIVQAMGVLFLVCTVALAVGMGSQSLLSSELVLSSAAGVVPALGGMWAGQRIRRRLPESTFRTLLFIALGVLGAFIAVQALT